MKQRSITNAKLIVHERSADNKPTEERPEVFGLLKLHAVKPTFLVVWQQMADPVKRRHAKRAVADRYRIGNHTNRTYTFGQFENFVESPLK